MTQPSLPSTKPTLLPSALPLLMLLCLALTNCAPLQDGFGGNKYAKGLRKYSVGNSFVYAGTITRTNGQSLPVRLKYTITEIGEGGVAMNQFVWVNGTPVVAKDKIVRGDLFPQIGDMSYVTADNKNVYYDRTVPNLYRQGIAYYDTQGTPPSSVTFSRKPTYFTSANYRFSRKNLTLGGRTYRCRVAEEITDTGDILMEESWYSDEIPGMVAMVKDHFVAEAGIQGWEIRYVGME